MVILDVDEDEQTASVPNTSLYDMSPKRKSASPRKGREKKKKNPYVWSIYNNIFYESDDDNIYSYFYHYFEQKSKFWKNLRSIPPFIINTTV